MAVRHAVAAAFSDDGAASVCLPFCARDSARMSDPFRRCRDVAAAQSGYHADVYYFSSETSRIALDVYAQQKIGAMAVCALCHLLQSAVADDAGAVMAAQEERVRCR